MRIIISCIGKIKSGPEFDLIQTYQKQCDWPVTICEEEVKKNLKGEPLQLAEAELLMKHLTSQSIVIILDERGKDLTSRDFASHLESLQINGARDVVFLIGGADGLHPTLKKRAQLSVCLGRMTWPHKLARVMLVEQLFRASTILKGHPYHRD